MRAMGAILLLRCALPTVAIVAGCGPTTGPGPAADVPGIYGMDSRFAADLRYSNDTLVGGRVLFAGGVPEAAATATQTAALYRDAGWTETSSTIERGTAKMTFRKGSRAASVRIMQNALDPAMSTAVLTLSE